MLRHGYLKSPIPWREVNEVRMLSVSPMDTVILNSAQERCTGSMDKS